VGGGSLCCHHCCRPTSIIGTRSGASQSPADLIDHRPALQDLDVITAVCGARCGQATFIAETMSRNFRSDLGRDGVLARVLLLMDKRWDLGNYLGERVVQGLLHGLPEIFVELMQLLDLDS